MSELKRIIERAERLKRECERIDAENARLMPERFGPRRPCAPELTRAARFARYEQLFGVERARELLALDFDKPGQINCFGELVEEPKLKPLKLSRVQRVLAYTSGFTINPLPTPEEDARDLARYKFWKRCTIAWALFFVFAMVDVYGLSALAAAKRFTTELHEHVEHVLERFTPERAPAQIEFHAPSTALKEGVSDVSNG